MSSKLNETICAKQICAWPAAGIYCSVLKFFKKKLLNVILFKLLEGRDSDFFFTAIPQRLPWNTVSAK